MSAAAELELILELLTLSRPGPGATIAQRRARYDKAANAFGTMDARAACPVVPIGHARGEWSRQAAAGAPVVLYLHGGSYALGSAASHRHLARSIGAEVAAAVLTLEYRRPPESRFPAAVDDALAAYLMLTGTGVPPGRITVVGDSAGAGLALALLQRLRSDGQPMPAGVACLSPWTDLGCSFPSHQTHAGRDPLLGSADLRAMGKLYLGGVPADEPLASPAFADLTGFPPMLVQAGSEEILLDDARRLARRARADGVSVKYEEWQGMFHVWQYYYPVLGAGRDAVTAIGRFLSSVLPAPPPAQAAPTTGAW